MKGKILKNVASLVGVALGILLLFYVARNIKDVEKIITQAGMAGPAVALFLYAIFAPTPVPTDPITIVCGAIYGPVKGTLIAWMGNNIAASIEYFLGKNISKNTDFEKEKNKLPFGLGKLPINSIAVLTLGRMLPFYGSKVISIMAGMYGVSYKRYVWTSALINMSGAIMLALGGFEILNLFKNL